jgi:hypothetical protein
MSLKKHSFFTFSILIFLSVIGCSPTVTPNPITPTPLPVAMQPVASQPTTHAIESNPKSNDTSEPTTEAPSIVDDPPIEKEVVVDSLYPAVEHLFPVRARVTVGGFLPDNCVEISSWKQSLVDNKLFIRPIITRPTLRRQPPQPPPSLIHLRSLSGKLRLAFHRPRLSF